MSDERTTSAPRRWGVTVDGVEVTLTANVINKNTEASAPTASRTEPSSTSPKSPRKRTVAGERRSSLAAVLAELGAVSCRVQPALEDAVGQLARVPARARALAEVRAGVAAVGHPPGVAPGTITSTCELAGAKFRALRAARCASSQGRTPRVPRNVLNSQVTSL